MTYHHYLRSRDEPMLGQNNTHQIPTDCLLECVLSLLLGIIGICWLCSPLVVVVGSAGYSGRSYESLMKQEEFTVFQHRGKVLTDQT